MRIPRVRFSLRTLLVVVTLLASVLGYSLWRSRTINSRLANIQRMGGHVTYEWEAKVGRMHDKEFNEAIKWHGLFTRFRNFIDHPHELWIDEEETGADIQQILVEVAWLDSIESVHIFSDNFNSDHARQIAQISSIVKLYIHSQGITADGVDALLKSKSLIELDLSGCTRISAGSEGLQEIAPNLKSLLVPNGELPHDVVERLRSRCPHCRIYD